LPEEYLNLASANRPEAPDLALRPRQVHTVTDRFAMANTYLVNDGRLFVVDPGPELNVRLLQQYLQRFLSRSAAEIDLIVLTHLHPDHTTGVETLKRLCRAPVAASATVQRLLRAETTLPRISHLAGQVLPGTLQHVDLFPPAYMRQARMIEVWLEDVAGLPSHPDWRVIATPGHAPESLCLYNAFTQELLCGDTLISIEGNAPRLRSQDYSPRMGETLRVLSSLPVRYLYPGHGRPVLSERPFKNVEIE
jgi:hydroxyacylglutathione hydrolase